MRGGQMRFSSSRLIAALGHVLQPLISHLIFPTYFSVPQIARHSQHCSLCSFTFVLCIHQLSKFFFHMKMSLEYRNCSISGS